MYSGILRIRAFAGLLSFIVHEKWHRNYYIWL